MAKPELPLFDALDFESRGLPVLGVLIQDGVEVDVVDACGQGDGRVFGPGPADSARRPNAKLSTRSIDRSSCPAPFPGSFPSGASTILLALRCWRSDRGARGPDLFSIDPSLSRRFLDPFRENQPA